MAKLSNMLWKYLVSIVPFKDTYFIKKEVPDIKLNKEIVRLNYGTYSPFKNGDILFFKDKSYVYIWFVKNKIETKKICIPEGFLMYVAYRDKFSKDGLAIKRQGDEYIIVVVKDGNMVSQLLSKSLDESFLSVLRKKYSIKENMGVFHIDDNYKFHVDVKSLAKFLDSIDINVSHILNNLYEQVKIPIITFLALVNIFDVFMYEYVNNAVAKSRHELYSLEKNNSELKQDFLTLEKESDFWKNFIKSELMYPNTYNVLSVISKIVFNSNGSINIFRQYGNLVDVWVVSDSTASVVNNLSTTGYFEDIKIVSTSKYPKDNTKEVGEIELRVKSSNGVR